MKLVKTNRGISVFNRDKCIGELKGEDVNDRLYIIFKIEIFDKEIEIEIGERMLSHICQQYPGKRILALSWGKEEDVEYEKCLNNFGFKIDFQKAYFSKDLSDFEYDDKSGLIFRPVTEIGRDVLVEVLEQIRKGDRATDNLTSVDEYFSDLLENMNEARAERWVIAYYEKQIVGIVLPIIFTDTPEKGSFEYFGVIPEFRGRRVGTSLYNKGLSLIKDLGAKEYLDSTHFENDSMIRIFEKGGCHKIGVRKHWINQSLI